MKKFSGWTAGVIVALCLTVLCIRGREIRTLGRTTAGNPGFAMGRGFDELGHGGALYVELDAGECRVEAVDLGCRIYQSLNVNVKEDPLASVEALLPEDCSRDIYRITLTGSCPSPDLEALRAALAPRFYALELIDRTLPPLELWRDVEEDSLKGLFLTYLWDRFGSAPGAAGREKILRAARYGLAAMENGDEPSL